MIGIEIRKYQYRYALYGVFFGMCFPIVGGIVQCWLDYMDFTFDNIIMSQQNSPLLWIIDTAPVFLGLIASFAGKQLDRVQEKNKELREKYQETNKLRIIANEANRAKSNFLANMSHEIRTPMNAILGLTYLALKEEIHPKVRKKLIKIDRSGKSLLRIINDILDFSKIEAGEVFFEEIDFDIEKMIRDVIDVANIKLMEKKQVEFVCDYDPTIPEYINSDATRIKQILTNLLDNSIKFTEKGEILLKCKLKEIDKNELTLSFEIHDTGIGISSSKLTEIFEPFKQEDESTTREFGGTGLGLVITKSLVQLMKGTIEVSSTKGKGTSFYFDLKVGMVHIPPKKEFLQRQTLRGMKVLLVDDSSTSRDALESMLQSFQFNVYAASSAKEGIEIYAQHEKEGAPISLIVADWHMPTMDGLQMIEQLQLSTNRNQSVLMVTACGVEALHTAKTDQLIDAYLVKPIIPSLLFDSIQQITPKTPRLKLNDEYEELDLIHYKKKLNGSKILIVEDNDINRDLAIELLQDVGIDCDTAKNGIEAIEKTVKNKYDLILMDIQMPIMDGLTASKEIRKRIGYENLPIIAMTAHAMIGESEKSFSAGMNEHLTKPIDPMQLYETLTQYIKESTTQISTPKESSDVEINSIQIPSILNINTAQGLQRANHKKDLYQKILTRYASNFASTSSEIETYWEDQNWEELMKLLHNIGGVTGNIGAVELSQKALEIAKEIRSQSSLKEISLSDLTQISQLNESVVEGIKSANFNLSTLSNSSPKKEFSSVDFKAEILTLIEKVKKSNPSSLKITEELLVAYKFPVETSEQLKIIILALDNLEFEEALDTLNSLL